MADNPLDALGNVFDEVVEAAGEVGSDLLQGDVEGAAQAAQAGAQETSAAVGEAATAAGQAVGGAATAAGAAAQQAAQAAESTYQEFRDWQEAHPVNLPDVGGEVGFEVLGQHVGAGGSLTHSPEEGLQWSAEVETPLGTREVSGEWDRMGMESSTSSQGVLGSDETSIGVGFDIRGGTAGVDVEHESSTDVGDVHLGSTEGSFHLGQDTGQPEEGGGPGITVDAGPGTGQGVVGAQVGTAASLAFEPGQPLMPTGQYAAPSGTGADQGAAGGGVAADAGTTEGAVAVEPGTQAGGVGADAGTAAEQPMAVAAEPPEAVAVAAPEPGAAVDEVGTSVGVVAEEAVVTAPAPADGEPAGVAVVPATSMPLAVEGDELVDEVGAPTGVAVAPAGSMPLAAEGGELVDEVGEAAGVAVAPSTSMPLAAEEAEVAAGEQAQEVDEIGAPTVVAAAAVATTMHVSGGEAEAVDDGEPQAVAVETTGEAVAWVESGEAAGSGVEEAAAGTEDAAVVGEEVTEDAAEDDGGSLGDILKNAAEAVGDFIEDVVDKIKDVFDGDD